MSLRGRGRAEIDARTRVGAQGHTLGDCPHVGLAVRGRQLQVASGTDRQIVGRHIGDDNLRNGVQTQVTCASVHTTVGIRYRHCVILRHFRIYNRQSVVFVIAVLGIGGRPNAGIWFGSIHRGDEFSCALSITDRRIAHVHHRQVPNTNLRLESLGTAVGTRDHHLIQSPFLRTDCNLIRVAEGVIQRSRPRVGWLLGIG